MTGPATEPAGTGSPRVGTPGPGPVAKPDGSGAPGTPGAGRAPVRRLAGARLISVSGSQAAQIALVYQIYHQTRSSAWVVAALAASMAVSGLLGPAAGWVADRFERRSTMVLSELGAGAAYLALVSAHRPGLLVVGVLVATVAGAPFRAASAASIPNLVAVEDLAWANGLLGASSNIGIVAGPFVGGALVAASGAGLVFAVNAASFLGSAVLIVGTHGRFGGDARAVAPGAPGPERSSLAGFGCILRSRLLTALTAATAVAFCAFGSALVIDPALAQLFHAGAIGYGLLTTAWGAGAVVGSIVAGRTITVSNAAAGVAWGMLGMAVSLGSIPLLPSFGLIVAAGTVGGIGNGFVFVPWMLLVQHHAPDEVRGRVVAAAEATEQVTFLTGMGVATAAIALLGAHHAYAVTGLLLFVGSALAAVGARRQEVATTASTSTPDLGSRR